MSSKFLTFIGGLGRTLIAAGLLILAFAGFQLWGTSLTEKQAQESLTEELDNQLAAKDIQSETSEPPLIEPLPSEGEPFGKIRIPSIGLEKAIVEGVQRETLRKAPGHYPDTALPGQAGNSAIAGHRTTYGQPFHDLDKLVPGDEIEVETVQGVFRYVVEGQEPPVGGPPLGHMIVAPNDTQVIDDRADNRLTLTACHPKFSAAQRIVVTAVLEGNPALTGNEPDIDDPPDLAMADEVAMAETETSFDESLGWQPAETKPTALWALITAGVAFAAWILGRLWQRRWAYPVVLPGFLIALFVCFTHLDRLIPAI